MKRTDKAGARNLKTGTTPNGGGVITLPADLISARYFEFEGVHLYTVLHGAEKPIARALLVGPFPSERFGSYIPWVRWARYLASRRIETLRFDYGGVGESTGDFQNMDFQQWSAQVQALGRWLKNQVPRLPLVLHGLEMGALLARRAFAADIGDALLLWSVPRSAENVLRRALWRQAFMRFSAGVSFADYIKALEAGGSLEVDGYVCSARLWREAIRFGAESESNYEAAESEGRIRYAKLEGAQGSVFSGSSMGRYVNLNPDLTDLFNENAEWLISAVQTHLRANL